MNRNRPLSPHLQVYRLPLTGLMSISHRVTGVLLSIGLIFFVYLVSMMASGEDAYQSLQGSLNTLVFKLIVWGFIYALFFHLCHGVRHLIWDSGAGFQRDTMNRYAVIELLASIALTLATFFLYL
ncbi:succinate dehydrogenase, cytochrome b556 subunit [Methylomarinum sp. Ch1-1]|uniref:Succinate dehydrogenase cytochrome b556 subunit n=1 Tax=Methylomarinum roseum TaxID=3067653 RepID=A0AAU7NQI2_9GAMM|nr:succinate dehydrogenase, cytochrome b556 subunit [Methylomarinum sp. Ch1-1]MDP4520799.1 succinate dehydrogenase, cytochrome b556 subunit [Methylomarinum sp. Ch1-1]